MSYFNKKYHIFRVILFQKSPHDITEQTGTEVNDVTVDNTISPCHCSRF
jgi:hypothetical protein